MSEKPLHVRVAEALGWIVYGEGPEGWMGIPPTHMSFGRPVPRYDTDWSAAGPLIDEYGITVLNCGGRWSASFKYDAYAARGEVDCNEGDSALETICNLILALKEAGKLEPETTQASPR